MLLTFCKPTCKCCHMDVNSLWICIISTGKRQGFSQDSERLPFFNSVILSSIWLVAEVKLVEAKPEGKVTSKDKNRLETLGQAGNRENTSFLITYT